MIHRMVTFRYIFQTGMTKTVTTLCVRMGRFAAGLIAPDVVFVVCIVGLFGHFLAPCEGAFLDDGFGVCGTRDIGFLDGVPGEGVGDDAVAVVSAGAGRVVDG